MTSSPLISPRLRISRVARRQNSLASSQLTISTELRGPCHLLGFLPVAAWYSSCVTSYRASANARPSLTVCAGTSFFVCLSPGGGEGARRGASQGGARPPGRAPGRDRRPPRLRGRGDLRSAPGARSGDRAPTARAKGHGRETVPQPREMEKGERDGAKDPEGAL